MASCMRGGLCFWTGCMHWGNKKTKGIHRCKESTDREENPLSDIISSETMGEEVSIRNGGGGDLRTWWWEDFKLLSNQQRIERIKHPNLANEPSEEWTTTSGAKIHIEIASLKENPRQCIIEMRSKTGFFLFCFHVIATQKGLRWDTDSSPYVLSIWLCRICGVHGKQVGEIKAKQNMEKMVT